MKANGRKVKINAILDDASNETFLNEAVAGILGLQEPFEKFQVYVLNNTVETFQSMPIKIEIETVHGKFSKEISTKTCPQKVTGNYNVVKWNDHQNKWLHLTQCNFPKPANDGLVDLLIGIDNAELHYSHVDLREAVLVRLTKTRPREHDLTLSVPCSLENLYGAREKNPVVTSTSLKKFGSDGDGRLVLTELALGKVKDSLKYENGRYRVAVPWKENKPDLPDTKSMRLSRFRSTERNLKKNSRVADEYQATIQAYVGMGYLRKVPSEEQPPANVWYLPHFSVVRMDKSTTSVRIVFDCAAKCDDISFNDMIHAGPKLQQDLFNVLVRFRRNPVGVTHDMKEMYLQIEIEEQDRSHFRLFWRDLDSNREPDLFEFSRVVFGKYSAPMESQFVAQENARRNQDRYPLATETVLKSTYMDDSINSPKVIEAIPTEEGATEIVINSGQDPITKTLGISWNSTEDMFIITASAVSPEFQTTKRNVLRKVATIFDPLGCVCPYVIMAKILLQEL